ncbi:hypothetical protein [Eggerthella timonensis]|uniref:hypothetical protein n=1 Tax=Eggerthella timonensis TaxID=1871008 RepID=UPI0015E0FE20|nr:hypothetical protein [Eggerthella timonensis]
MKLEVEKSFSGALGCAGVGQTIEVSAAVGKRMIKEGYPVVEVKERGGNRKAQGDEAAQ